MKKLSISIMLTTFIFAALTASALAKGTSCKELAGSTYRGMVSFQMIASPDSPPTLVPVTVKINSVGNGQENDTYYKLEGTVTWGTVTRPMDTSDCQQNLYKTRYDHVDFISVGASATTHDPLISYGFHPLSTLDSPTTLKELIFESYDYRDSGSFVESKGFIYGVTENQSLTRG